MAKKKEKKKTTARRVGALSLSKNKDLLMYGSIAAGYLLADKINPAIDKAVGDKIDSKLVAAGQAGLGALLVFKKSGGKMAMVKTIGGGIMLGSGVKRAMSAFGIGGYQMVPAVGAYQPAINGYQMVPAVGASRVRRIGAAVGAYTPGAGGMNGYQVPGRRASINGNGSGLIAR